MIFANPQWWLLALPIGILLAFLAWRSWLPLSLRPLALAFRLLGIAILLLALLDPQRLAQRPLAQANALAILLDNSESMQLDNRNQSALAALSETTPGWLAELETVYQIRRYGYDRELRRVENFAQLDFAGGRSSLGAGLGQLSSRLSGQPLAGIVVFTDGNATDLAALEAALPNLPPIFPILVGSSSPLPDLSLAHASIRQSPFEDSPLSLRAEIVAQNQQGSIAQLSVDPIELPGQRSLALVAAPPPPTQTLRIDQATERQTLTINWNPDTPGLQFYRVALAAAPNEATTRNNSRLLMADRGKSRYRILYVTGRPNWEYKFLNRALAADPQLDLVGIIRIAKREPKFDFKGRAGESSNPLYRGFGREDETERYDQPVIIRMNTRDADELREGFPRDAESLFAYDAIILDDIEADFFSFSQQSLLRSFVSQRGGGLLVLGGTDSFAEGGWGDSPLEQALPIYLDRFVPPPNNRSFTWSLTREGWVEPWTRIRSNESEERIRLNSMPPFLVANLLPHLKPGARQLASLENESGETYPALVARQFGSGKVATLAAGDLWRWGMQDAAQSEDLARFWRQLARWLVTDTTERVSLLAEPSPTEGIRLLASSLDSEYRPLELGRATLLVRRVSGDLDSGFRSAEIDMTPVSNEPGRFSAELPPLAEGAYFAQVVVTDGAGHSVGQAETGWVSEPSIAEFANLAPNRDLLARLASRTGGELLSLDQLDRLPAALAQRPSPLMETWNDPLWHRSWVLAAALLCFLAEWAIRRRKGLA